MEERVIKRRVHSGKSAFELANERRDCKALRESLRKDRAIAKAEAIALRKALRGSLRKDRAIAKAIAKAEAIALRKLLLKNSPAALLRKKKRRQKDVNRNVRRWLRRKRSREMWANRKFAYAHFLALKEHRKRLKAERIENIWHTRIE